MKSLSTLIFETSSDIQISGLINTFRYIMNRSDQEMEVMHERNAHNFPFDLAW